MSCGLRDGDVTDASRERCRNTRVIVLQSMKIGTITLFLLTVILKDIQLFKRQIIT
jgi:hypothetical protein